MSRRLPLLLALCLLVACAGRGREAVDALERRTLDVGGLEREYFVYAPRALPPGPRPLVFAIHGGGGRGDGFARQVGPGLHPLADRDGFVVVYPHALRRLWDFGEEEVSDRLEVRVDDRGYFEALLDALPRRYAIDPQRVFVAGLSRGGQAAYFMACTFPGRIRAIAAVTMPLPRFLESPCASSPPLGVALLNGTEDPLVPYEGGHIEFRGRKRGQVLSTDATAAFWRERNGCRASPTREERIDPTDDGTSVVRTAWTDCRSAPVVLYRIEGGGHTWPSGTPYLPRFLIGRLSRDVDASREIWEFFRGFD